jgi:EAL domain-containing protein (putative c-di-GMP-specific phosphodiesterase class I)
VAGDDATVKLLREFGVNYAQGFHIGRPAPVVVTA